MSRRLPALAILLATGVASLLTGAENLNSTKPEVTTPPGPWTSTGRVGAFLNNTSSANSTESRDASVASAQGSTSALTTIDAKVVWSVGLDAVEQNLKGRYGRSRTLQEGWSENEDELRYDGVYRRTIRPPHFVYLSWGSETGFSGFYVDEPARPPDNPRNPGDPLKAHLGGGYGERFVDLVPEDSLEWRLGARVEKNWGTRVRPEERGFITGAEVFVRYEGTPNAYHQDLRYFAQYEGFSRFNDLGHISNLITAGLTFQLAKHLNLDLALRAYYETRPWDDREEGFLAGYNQWSVKQDTLIGIVYGW